MKGLSGTIKTERCRKNGSNLSAHSFALRKTESALVNWHLMQPGTYGGPNKALNTRREDELSGSGRYQWFGDAAEFGVGELIQ